MRWLSAATEGLEHNLAAEVRAELADHYEDACAAYEAKGHSPSSAQATALVDLGDARTVQRMLRRVHLSRGERFVGWLNRLTPDLWRHRALIATALFGLLALVVVVGDHRHWISYRGHYDAMTPIALTFVVASLLLERRPAVWSYPAVGYLLTGIWPWLYFRVEAHVSGPLWGILAPLLLPPAVLIALSAMGLRTWRRNVGRRLPAGAWLITALIAIVIAGTTLIQLSDATVVFRSSSALVGRRWLANVPWGLYTMAMALMPVAIGLLAAARQGIFATLIPLGAHFALFVAIADPTYHPTFYDGIWQPARAMGTIEAIMTSLPALALFIVTPLWMLQARASKVRALAAWGPAAVVLALANAFGTVDLHQVGASNTAAMVNTLLMSLRALLPILLAVSLYRRRPAGMGEMSPAERESDAPPDPTIRRLEHRRLT